MDALIWSVQQIIGQKQDCQKRLKNRDDKHNKVARHRSGEIFPVEVFQSALSEFSRGASSPFLLCHSFG